MGLDLKIYDVSPFVHSAMGKDSLSSKKRFNMSVGGMISVLNKLTSHIRQGVDVVLAFDSRSFRKDLNPSYKKNRESKPYVTAQIDFLYKNLLEIGLPVYKIDGLEADDIIFNAVEELYDKYNSIEIFSTDYDLVHNLDAAGKVYFTSITKDVNCVSTSNFEYAMPKNKGLMFNTLTAYKVFTGDSSDNIGVFTSESGVRGKVLYEAYINFLQQVGRTSTTYTKNSEVLRFFISKVNTLTENDKKILLDRVEIFYPRKEEIKFTPIHRDTVNMEKLVSFLALLGDFDSLRNLRVTDKISDIEFSADKKQEMFELSRSLVTGEYQVDRGQSVNVLDVFDDVGPQLTLVKGF